MNYEVSSTGAARWRINALAWTETGNDWISTIPIQLHSERVRDYDITGYFWVTNDSGSSLVEGTDYSVLDESGAQILGTSGKYHLVWPNAVKGIQNVVIKRISASTGVLKVNTLNPANGTPLITQDTYIEATTNNITEDYELRGLSADFNKVTVTFN